ncbi:MAG: hypothetical protein WA687_10665 [Solirubrobacterales bacterium]
MEAMRESWTDARLDDGFDRVAADIKALRGETGEMHKEIGSLRAETTSLRAETTSLRRDLDSFRLDTSARLDRLEGRFDDLQRTMMQLGGGIGGGIIAALIGVIATQL